MIPQNRYIWIEPVKEGMISGSSGNEYIVKDVDPSGDVVINTGDKVIVDEQVVIRVTVDGKETFFVREQDILAVIPVKE